MLFFFYTRKLNGRDYTVMSHESSGILLSPSGYTTGMGNPVLPIIVPLLSKRTNRVYGELPFPLTRVNGFSVADLTVGAFVIGKQDLE